jgi:hypothetical protein
LFAVVDVDYLRDHLQILEVFSVTGELMPQHEVFVERIRGEVESVDGSSGLKP